MKRVPWLVVSGLMALSLVLAACAPAVVKEEEKKITVTEKEEAAVQKKEAVPETKVSVSPDVPRYGGTFTARISGDPTNWDSGLNRRGGALIGTVYEQFVATNPAKEVAYRQKTGMSFVMSSMDDYGGEVAESWEMPTVGVWKLKIRQGVHWQPVPSAAGRLMNGRELTADDIVSGFNRLLNRDGKAPDSWIIHGQPGVAKTATIEKTGPREVTIRTPVEYMTAFLWIIAGGGFYRIYPPEVIATYGNLGDWRNAVGTGPFMLIDYVPGSQMIFKKNPLYWGRDPVGPGEGNQVPYIDTYRELILPDASTAQAALRTGKIDTLSGMELVDAQSLWKTAPDLQSIRSLGATYVLAMRQDKPGKPYSDVRVRRALMMATDFEAIKSGFYNGEAEINVYPINVNARAWWVPLEQMPESVQELYRYNPDKAKQLLKEAGYPNGFKATIAVQSNTSRIDELSIYKDMWAKVGVELVFDIKEAGAYATLTAAGNPYDDMLYRGAGSAFSLTLYLAYARGPAIINPSHINDPAGSDPYLEDLFNQLNANIFVNWTKVDALIKEVNLYLMDGAYAIPKPVPYSYSFWWPWVKNNYGQGTRFYWIDETLKKSMGY